MHFSSSGLGFARKAGTEQIHHAGAYENFSNILSYLNSEVKSKKDKKRKKDKINEEKKTSESSPVDGNSESTEDGKTKPQSLESISQGTKRRIQWVAVIIILQNANLIILILV